MQVRSQARLLAALAGGCLLLSACDLDDRGDSFRLYEPGVYQGKVPAELSPQVLDELRQRAQLQGG